MLLIIERVLIIVHVTNNRTCTNNSTCVLVIKHNMYTNNRLAINPLQTIAADSSTRNPIDMLNI